MTKYADLISRLEADIRRTGEALHDSQEHSQIVRLETKIEGMQAELKRLRALDQEKTGQ